MFSRLRPDVRDRQTDRQTDARRQTDVRRASSLNALYPRGGGIIISNNDRLSKTPSQSVDRRSPLVIAFLDFSI